MSETQGAAGAGSGNTRKGPAPGPEPRADGLPDPAELSRQMAEIAEKSQRLVADFLTRLDERNRGQGEQNGLFASHPQTADRIARVNKVAGAAGALVAARYVATVQYKPTDITKVAVVTEGKDTKAANQAAQKPAEPKSGGIGLGALRQTIAPEKQSGQVSASGGARGVGPDRLARGGDNPTLVKVTISAADLAGFRKGIS